MTAYIAASSCYGFGWRFLYAQHLYTERTPLLTSPWPEEVPVAVSLPVGVSPQYRLACPRALFALTEVLSASRIFDASDFVLVLLFARLIRRGCDPFAVNDAMTLADGPYCAANVLISCVGGGYLTHAREAVKALPHEPQGLYETVLAYRETGLR